MRIAAASLVRAMATDMPTASDLPAWIVRLCAPAATVRLVVEVAEVPGAEAALAALLAAACALP